MLYRGKEGMYFTRLGFEDGGAGAFAVEAEKSHRKLECTALGYRKY